MVIKNAFGENDMNLEKLSVGRDACHDKEFSFGQLEEQRDFRKRVLTEFISQNNGIALIHVIRKNSINVNEIVPRTGKTCLGLAIEAGADQVVDSLILEKADPNQTDIFGKTPLKYLIEQEDIYLERLEKDVKSDEISKDDSRIMSLCVIANSLLNAGASIHIANERKMPLLLLGRCGPVSTVIKNYLEERKRSDLSRC